MHYLSYLIAYVLVSLLVPVSFVVLRRILREPQQTVRPVRSCRWCGEGVMSATDPYCSDGCENSYGDMYQQIAA